MNPNAIAEAQVANNIREERPSTTIPANAPSESLKVTRQFIEYIFGKKPDIGTDNSAQNRWLSQDLRKALAHRQDVVRKYLKSNPDTPEGPPDNSDFIGSWDHPTSYSIVGTRMYAGRAIIDIVFSWGKNTQYAGDTRLVSYVFVHEGDAWKLDDIYTFRGEFTSGPHSLSAEFLSNTFP